MCGLARARAPAARRHPPAAALSACAGAGEAADPDKPPAQIGVLLEQDPQTGGRVGSTLFKSFNTGRIFDVAPAQLKLDPSGDRPGPVDPRRRVPGAGL